ncbi:hypothetical protein [Hymenobacter elongatus]|uniref:Uncharacterized protein n=1 Tax=Hymenobacter elongatus TaxID=877208 RepID=A0A4Z0PTL5_9BACT|nr:hypothetical protein [Hymenobacter elongatus]TGE19742.1 hypothetical protein E5J99_02990 [Hymenobacter elongatus]
MKTLSLLLLAAFLSVDSAEIVAAPAATVLSDSTTLTASTFPIFGTDASKRRKRKKKRPAYRRRLGSHAARAVVPTAA